MRKSGFIARFTEILDGVGVILPLPIHLMYIKKPI